MRGLDNYKDRSSQTSLSSVDWSSIYDALDNPHQYEGYISSRCPFHDDSRPSFFVYNDWYKCLSCGAQGPTSQLLQRLGKIVRSPRRKDSSYTGPINPFSMWLKTMTLKTALKAAWQTINQNPGMGNYITKDRGIAEPYRKLLGIGYIDDWYTFPIRNKSGTIISAVARKGRDNHSTSKYVLPNGTNPNILYVPNWNRVRNADYLILTFGILDAVVLAMLGEPAASTISGKQLNKIALVQFRKPILLIPDRQEEQNGLELVQKLGWRGQLVKADWPENCKDINDIWVKDRKLCKGFVNKLTAQIRGFNDGTTGSM